MKVFTIGFAKAPFPFVFNTLYRPPSPLNVSGLVHAECLTPMVLGSHILSPGRMQFSKIVMFAAWESEDAIEEFLNTHRLGVAISEGWHLRMKFLRRWGMVRQFASLPETIGESDPMAPVAAFTLARMKMLEIPRFIHWGRPVETLIRDHPDATFTSAAIRHPRTVATFTIWKSQQAMVNMVQGHSTVDRPTRHSDAMKELDRRNFHHEFTTLRFQPLSEHGTWEGRATLLPTP